MKSAVQTSMIGLTKVLLTFQVRRLKANGLDRIVFLRGLAQPMQPRMTSGMARIQAESEDDRMGGSKSWTNPVREA